jgi:ribosomal protein S18 acetylase RimI-like enzyme
MKRLDIRPVREDELHRVARMNIQLQRDEGSRELTCEDARARLKRWLKSTYRCVVFTQDGNIVGYAVYRPTNPDAEGHLGGIYIRQFFVVPALRRRGLGRRVFTRLRAEVFPRGCYLTINARSQNHAGQAFWQALGFVPHSIRYELDFSPD